MRDTRPLFMGICTCKEGAWDQLEKKQIDDERMRILMGLPRKQVAWDTSPMDDIFYKSGDGRDAGEPGRSKHVPLECVVERMGSEDDQLQYFYVNNEGYSYARYCFRFEPRAGETGT